MEVASQLKKAKISRPCSFPCLSHFFWTQGPNKGLWYFARRRFFHPRVPHFQGVTFLASTVLVRSFGKFCSILRATLVQHLRLEWLRIDHFLPVIWNATSVVRALWRFAFKRGSSTSGLLISSIRKFTYSTEIFLKICKKLIPHKSQYIRKATSNQN